MHRHLMGPGDVGLVRWAQDPQLSSDSSELAWCEVSMDLERDEPVTNIMVAPADGSGVPRRFSEGPHDFSPRWSPDGRYLAYLAAVSGPPALYLASLAGGAPFKVVTPGPVRSFEWSPSGDRLVLVVDVTGHEDEVLKPAATNAARVVRGLFNRLDGEGWYEGRKHLFIYDVEDQGLHSLTSGDYDHAFPSWSPDGSMIVFVSDRSRRRDNRISAGDLWTVPAKGGRPRRLATHIGDAGFPTFSPDGSRLAFTGLAGSEQRAGRNTGLFVVDVEGTSTPEQVVPGLDRPVGFTLGPRPFVWLSPQELAFTVADSGTIGVRRARLGGRNASALVGGEVQVNGITVSRAGRRALAYAASWADKPSEVFCLDLAKRLQGPVQVSRAGAQLEQSVELLPAERLGATAPDGTEVEYFVIRPKRLPGRRRPALAPLFLEVHGGPHLYNPIGEAFVWYQTLAGAGYLVVLPNPRGSIGYGESFSSQLVGGWGRADFDDLMACTDDVIARGLAAEGRQFVGGYSYGGFMSAWVVGHTTRFKAASVGAPVVNLASMFGTSDGNVFFADAMKADPWAPVDYLRSHSPLTYAPDIETPVLIYVNDGDLRCPPGQADELYTALKWLGKDVEYVRYPGGSHSSFFSISGAPSQCEDRSRRILEFLGRHGGISAPSTKPPGP